MSRFDLRGQEWEPSTPPPAIQSGPVGPQCPPFGPPAMAGGGWIAGRGPALLSKAEFDAMDLTGKLVELVTGEIIGRGPTREGDCNEFVHHVHNIQRMILKQAAARAYPDRFRLLGEVVGAGPGASQ